MGDIIGYLLANLLLRLIGIVLPRIRQPIKRAAKSIIDRRVARRVKQAERKFVGAKLGEQKKAWVLTQTKYYDKLLTKADDTIDNVIEGAVQLMNTRATSANSSMSTAAGKLIKSGVNVFKNKFFK